MLEEEFMKLLSRELSRPLDNDEAAYVRDTVESHGLDDSERAAAVEQIVQNIVGRVPSTGLQVIDSGYPGGTSGLDNVFEDLCERFPIDWDSPGESILGRFPRSGMMLYVDLETPTPQWAVVGLMSRDEFGVWSDRARGRPVAT